MNKLLAYTLGYKYFWTLILEVNESTLIPRFDTEALVDVAIERILKWKEDHPNQVCKIAELGTGTAAIPLALCSELSDLHIISVDVFPKVIEVANKNIQKYKELLNPRNNSIELIQNNLFPDSLEEQNFIISNPPYVRSNKISNPHEPHSALDGGTDGLYFYRYLLEDSPIKSDGEMILEISGDQKNDFYHSNWSKPKFIFEKQKLQFNVAVLSRDTKKDISLESEELINLKHIRRKINRESIYG
jgi:release factor glutamine methyltransferase